MPSTTIRGRGWQSYYRALNKIVISGDDVASEGNHKYVTFGHEIDRLLLRYRNASQTCAWQMINRLYICTNDCVNWQFLKKMSHRSTNTQRRKSCIMKNWKKQTRTVVRALQTEYWIIESLHWPHNARQRATLITNKKCTDIGWKCLSPRYFICAVVFGQNFCTAELWVLILFTDEVSYM